MIRSGKISVFLSSLLMVDGPGRILSQQILLYPHYAESIAPGGPHRASGMRLPTYEGPAFGRRAIASPFMRGPISSGEPEGDSFPYHEGVCFLAQERGGCQFPYYEGANFLRTCLGPGRSSPLVREIADGGPLAAMSRIVPQSDLRGPIFAPCIENENRRIRLRISA